MSLFPCTLFTWKVSLLLTCLCSRAHCSHGKSHYSQHVSVPVHTVHMESLITANMSLFQCTLFTWKVSLLPTCLCSRAHCSHGKSHYCQHVSVPVHTVHMDSLITAIMSLFPSTLFAWKVVTTSACSISANSTLKFATLQSVSDGLGRPANASECFG